MSHTSSLSSLRINLYLQWIILIFQENEVQSIEKALVKFWKDHPELVGTLGMVPSEDQPRAPSATPRTIDSSEEAVSDHQKGIQFQSFSAPQKVLPSPPSIADEASEQSFIPKLYIRVADQQKNVAKFDMAHRAGLISNLAHKLISNIVGRSDILTFQLSKDWIR